jgi:ABC-type transporter Mla subunit MlaD
MDSDNAELREIIRETLVVTKQNSDDISQLARTVENTSRSIEQNLNQTVAVVRDLANVVGHVAGKSESK